MVARGWPQINKKEKKSKTAGGETEHEHRSYHQEGQRSFSHAQSPVNGSFIDVSNINTEKKKRKKKVER